MKQILALTGILFLLFDVSFVNAATPCDEIVAQTFHGMTVATIGSVASSSDTPAFCRINGTIEPQIAFEMRLPTQTWNGNFYQAGCGGFCGDFNADKAGYSNTIVEAVKRGYAAIIVNNGHTGGLADASWAVNNETALQVYADTGVPLVADAARQLIRAFYGKPPRRAYFAGCSNGGRMAAIAAQRYPQLFDGILAGAPVMDLTENGGLYGSWIVQKNRAPDGGVIIDSAFNVKIPKLRAEIARQCPAAMDRTGAIVTDPRACRFEAEQLPVCASGEHGASCFTDRERAVLAAWYSGPRDSAGNKLFAGTPLGSEPFWPVWLTGTAKSRPVGMDLGSGYLKMAFSPKDLGPALDSSHFNFDRDPPRLASRAGAFNAMDPNLSAFAKAGGKLLMYQGWADPVVLPETAARYYDAAVAQNGGLKSTQDFFRLFMIAGVGHCWEAPAEAPDQFDPIAALEDWVERGQAPNAIPIAQSDRSGSVVRRALLHPYPQLETLDP